MRSTAAVALTLLLVAGACSAPGGPGGAATSGHADDTAGGAAAADDGLPSIAEKTAGWERRDGLLTTWIDADGGAVWLQLPPPDGPRGECARVLAYDGLRTGLGSNPVGLDRGRLGESRLLVLRRFGPKVLFEQPNLRFRASSDRDVEVTAAEESFATSVIWGAEIAALDDDGGALVDLTSFLVRDAHGAAATLTATGQGPWQLDPARSALLPDACLAFPDNLEFEALLTFAGSAPGGHVASTAPDARAVTLRTHQSLVRLPDDAFRTRDFDPRAGGASYYGADFLDYSAPLGTPLERQFAVRHRLQRTEPTAPVSRVVEPIVYYVDRGVPEPVRSALLDGARWWEQAFEEAGFVDAYRVELLPEGVHPLDVRYHVITWVHRSTRGWSYGGAVADPRTGEIVKGHVSLGSLRVRQDELLFEGLLGVANTGSGRPDDPIELALARIRQLAAHEVGHTLGLSHNFAASTYAGRASVMDYPAPLIELDQRGELDVSRAYAQGLGAWDRFAILHLYGQPPGGDPADEAAWLNGLVERSVADGMLYLSDADARPAGAAHPLANLWDNGADPAEALRTALDVRRVALSRFGMGNLAPGRPLARLHEVFVPVYFHHRYQLEAAIKIVGGVEYGFATVGGPLTADGRPASRPTDPEWQLRALDLILDALEPAHLDISDEISALLLPRPPGHPPHRELLDGHTDPVFDPLAAAATAARLVVAGLLQPERCARVLDHARRDENFPSLSTVLDALWGRAFPRMPSQTLDEMTGGEPERLAATRRAVQRVVVDGLIALARDTRAAPAVRAEVEARLMTSERLLRGAVDRGSMGPDYQHLLVLRHMRALSDDIRRHLERQGDLPAAPSTAAPPPPGSPIGAGARTDLCSWISSESP